MNDNMILIHQLALVPTITNCRDWKSWTFLGECQTCMLRLHIAKYLKQFQSFWLVENGLVNHYHFPPHQPAAPGRRSGHHEHTTIHCCRSSTSSHRRRRHHWHMEAFIDRIIIPTHPPHWLADHPNIYQCSRMHHARLTRHRAATTATTRAAAAASASVSSSSLTSFPRQQQHQLRDNDVDRPVLKDRSLNVKICQSNNRKGRKDRKDRSPP